MLTDHTLYAALSAAGRPALVAFGTPGCGGCRALRAALPDLQAALPELDVHYAEAERCPGVLDDLEAFHLPALFVFVDGDAHAAVQAPLRVPALAAAARAALAGPPTAP